MTAPDPAATAITNPKLATLAPRWAPYRGLSVLFDNPDDQRLYDALAAAVPAGWSGERFGFCALPRDTFHVTLCDGPNDHDLAQRDARLAADLADAVEQRPGSFAALPPGMDVLLDPALLQTVTDNPVTFEAAEVAIWGYVLAVRLEAADDRSRTAVAAIADARAGVAARLRAGLGVRVQPWRPHVSLGYFPNREAAAAATTALPAWTSLLDGAATITFTSAAVYTFTDMVSFVRLDA